VLQAEQEERDSVLQGLMELLQPLKWFLIGCLYIYISMVVSLSG